MESLTEEEPGESGLLESYDFGFLMIDERETEGGCRLSLFRIQTASASQFPGGNLINNKMFKIKKRIHETKTIKD